MEATIVPLVLTPPCSDPAFAKEGEDLLVLILPGLDVVIYQRNPSDCLARLQEVPMNPLYLEKP